MERCYVWIHLNRKYKFVLVHSIILLNVTQTSAANTVRVNIKKFKMQFTLLKGISSILAIFQNIILYEKL